jgi:hypothetical protein
MLIQLFGALAACRHKKSAGDYTGAWGSSLKDGIVSSASLFEQKHVLLRVAVL